MKGISGINLKMKNDNLSKKIIMDMARGFQKSRILLTAVELEIFTVLGTSGKTADQVAEEIAADARATDRILNALTAMGFTEKTGNTFSNSPVSEKYLDQKSPEYIWRLKHSVNQWNSWSTLTQAVKKGTRVAETREKFKNEKMLNSFIGAMHYRAQQDADSMVSKIDTGGISRILDVGGGSGAYSMAFIKKNKTSSAVVFDLPDVIPITKKYIQEAGLSDRIETIPGDYLSDDFGSGYDLVLMSAIIHINTSQENFKLIQKGTDALRKGGCLVVQDFIVDESRTSPEHAVIFALNMLTATERGDTYTESEIREWMQSAGLFRITRKDYGPQHNLMIGWKT